MGWANQMGVSARRFKVLKVLRFSINVMGFNLKMHAGSSSNFSERQSWKSLIILIILIQLLLNPYFVHLMKSI